MPVGYEKMQPIAQQECRLRLLHSWYDPCNRGQWIAFPANFVAAFRFFLNNYLKGWSGNAERYYLPDCRWVDTWIKMLVHPTVGIAAFRGSGKTFTIVRAYPIFAALTRPRSIIQVTEINDERCTEEMQEIQEQLEENECIRHDFGYQRPKVRSGNWNVRTAKLVNGSLIKAVSAGAAIRGRHPHLMILDDPEDDAQILDPEWRQWFVDVWLFKSVFGMLKNSHGHFVWIGTLLHELACLNMAVFKKDVRFVNWATASCPLIVTDPQTGERRSMWPENITVEEFDLMVSGEGTKDGRIRGLGRAAAFTEYQNKPTTNAQRALPRDDHDHGYYLLEDADQKRWIWTPFTQKYIEYDIWIDNVSVLVGLDPVSNESNLGDYAAMAVLAKDHEDVLWLLDAWQGRGRFIDVIMRAYQVCDQWRARRLCYEYVGTQGREFTSQINDYWRDKAAAGLYHGGELRPCKNTGRSSKNKIVRMMDMQYRFLRRGFKHPIWNSTEHPPPRGMRVIRPHNWEYISILIEQIDSFTESGVLGHDDLLDSVANVHLECTDIVVREASYLSPTDKVIKRWKKWDYVPDKASVPMDAWTADMWAEALSLPESEAREGDFAYDPWD